jgi:hypothetical protein
MQMFGEGKCDGACMLNRTCGYCGWVFVFTIIFSSFYACFCGLVARELHRGFCTTGVSVPGWLLPVSGHGEEVAVV